MVALNIERIASILPLAYSFQVCKVRHVKQVLVFLDIQLVK
jgi:hypothetical protein